MLNELWRKLFLGLKKNECQRHQANELVEEARRTESSQMESAKRSVKCPLTRWMNDLFEATVSRWLQAASSEATGDLWGGSISDNECLTSDIMMLTML